MGRDPFKEIVMEIINSEIEKAELRRKSIAKEEVNKSVLEIAKNMIKYNCTKEQVINSTNITEEEYLSLLEA